MGPRVVREFVHRATNRSSKADKSFRVLWISPEVPFIEGSWEIREAFHRFAALRQSRVYSDLDSFFAGFSDFSFLGELASEAFFSPAL